MRGLFIILLLLLAAFMELDANKSRDKWVVDCVMMPKNATECYPYSFNFFQQTREKEEIIGIAQTDTNETNLSTEDNSAPPEIASGERREDKNIGLYTIKEGDNINSIAQKFFIKSYDIKKLNGLNQTIITGKKLKLPLPQYKINAIDKGTYIVKKGDTLGHIALNFHLKPRNIIRFNQLNEKGSIKVGQKLILPFTYKMNDLVKQEQEREKKDTLHILTKPLGRQLKVTATAYTSHVNQTQGDPFVGAWNNRLTPGQKVIAVSRDLLNYYGLKNGSKVKISGLEGYYTVRDKMNKRYSKRIDIYMGLDKKEALRWGKRSVNIYW
ncbi:MAG: LysM peptidoglycan-binding domain-containing protein [Campylobacterales bacterium]|nr:LysM peptidoglycan-binding domain-containing protein [Campylobacterales bacterium]